MFLCLDSDDPRPVSLGSLQLGASEVLSLDRAKAWIGERRGNRLTAKVATQPRRLRPSLLSGLSLARQYVRLLRAPNQDWIGAAVPELCLFRVARSDLRHRDPSCPDGVGLGVGERARG